MPPAAPIASQQPAHISLPPRPPCKHLPGNKIPGAVSRPSANPEFQFPAYIDLLIPVNKIRSDPAAGYFTSSPSLTR